MAKRKILAKFLCFVTDKREIRFTNERKDTIEVTLRSLEIKI